MKFQAGFFSVSLLILNLLVRQTLSQVHKIQSKSDNVVAEMQVLCRSDSIVLKMNTNSPFNGMVYAKDALHNENCVSEFKSSSNMTFMLPLKSCGTLFADADDGIEYFNTVVVQPHMRLMTNQGRGYHIRCKYQTRERTIANTHFNVSASFMMQNNPKTATMPLLATASMPSCTMKIFRSGRDDVAETVKIGDKLIMVIEIDQQDMYGMKITNCVVRDGLNTAEQQLIDDVGCPIDENIMPKFEYTNNSTRAAVSFPAHKFPHTGSVYYQCNVRLCINNGGCNHSECPTAGQLGNASNFGGPRKKRFAAQLGSVGHHDSQQQQPESRFDKEDGESETAPALPEPSPLKAGQSRDGSTMSFDVYSGLYVDDIDIDVSGSSDSSSKQVSPPTRRRSLTDSSESICLSVGQLSLMVLVSSLTTVGVLLLLVCQVGLFGGNKQQVSKSSQLFSPSASLCSVDAGRELRTGGVNLSQASRRHYQYDTDTLG